MYIHPNSHTHCQVTQVNCTNQNLSKSMVGQSHGCKPKVNTQNGKTRKPNKMYSECALQPFSSIQAIRYFSVIRECERTHHT